MSGQSWQAVWKIYRVICEELKIKYPTAVYGTVTNVLFKDLKAIFSIIAIQDDDIHLPEEHEVPLVDLWLTKVQENPAINIDVTANCVDMISFFFKNLWMPWVADNDEDVDWSKKYLESRIRFCYDLKTDINPALASHIRAFLAEAQDIQQRREYLELDISDDEVLDNLNCSIVGIEACDNSIDLRLKNDIDGSKQPVIMAKEFENILLTLAGNLKIKNVILDCRKVSTGILIREGSVHFEDCTFVGDKSSSTSTAIIMLENTTVSLENCVIKYFSTALAMRAPISHSKTLTISSLSLTDSIIYNVSTGVECTEIFSFIQRIENCQLHPLWHSNNE